MYTQPQLPHDITPEPSLLTAFPKPVQVASHDQLCMHLQEIHVGVRWYSALSHGAPTQIFLPDSSELGIKDRRERKTQDIKT
jgi:hypothetical protein